jgi:hypothetical protein
VKRPTAGIFSSPAVGTYTLAVGVPTKKPRANTPSFVIRLKHAGAFSGLYPSSKANNCTLRPKTPPSSLMECREVVAPQHGLVAEETSWPVERRAGPDQNAVIGDTRRLSRCGRDRDRECEKKQPSPVEKYSSRPWMIHPQSLLPSMVPRWLSFAEIQGVCEICMVIVARTADARYPLTSPK